MARDYRTFIEDHFLIIDKEGHSVPFRFNKIQDAFYQAMTGSDVILKARQQGFSTLITAIFTVDFLLVPNSYSVILADNKENAEALLIKVKKYIKSYNEITGEQLPMEYDTKQGMVNEFMNSTFVIGTAGSEQFGRSRTITNLHCSEVAFYPDIDSIMSGAGQAVAPTGRKIFETTANGLNQFYDFYNEAKNGQSGFKAHFFKASAFYTPAFLDAKRLELKRTFPQEYPETDIEAFLTSGECYFDLDALKVYYDGIKKPIEDKLVYYEPVTG